MRRWVLAVSLAAGCGAEPLPGEIPATLITAESTDDFVETPLDGTTARGVEGTQWLTDGPDGLVLVDALDGPIELGPATAFDGAWTASGTLLVLDGALFSWDGTSLEPSPLAPSIPMPVETVMATPWSLALAGAGRLVLFRDGRVSEIRLDDGAEIQGFAAGSDGILWLALPELIGIDLLAEGLPVVTTRMDLRVRDLAVDADSTLWVEADGELLARRSTGSWARFDAGGDVLEVEAHPSARDVWIRTSEETLHHRGGRFTRAAVPEGDWTDSDELGRLYVSAEGGAVRVSHGRPVAVRGLRPGEALRVRTEVEVIPEIDGELSAWVGALELPIIDGTVALDPEELPEGALGLRFVQTEAGRSWVSELPFQVGELPATTWTDDLERLAESRCLACHDGATSTRLDTAEAWRVWIDAIIDEVSTARMPLGGPELTEEEVARIRGWKAGGFPN